ncbi:MAG: Endonuclease [Pedosphaera sp.]|nr:Endonuclease [Pedosphaera sp.]
MNRSKSAVGRRGLGRAGGRGGKRPFDIDVCLERVEEAVRPFAKAVLFELAEEGFGSVFELLVACIISIRTLDEVTVPVAHRLFAKAQTAGELSGLSVAEIDGLIAGCTFHEAKARSLLEIARTAVSRYGGDLPCDEKVLMGLRGVGPKCANLVLGVACGQGRIGVDIHVHRVTNRWGYVATKSPEETMARLEERLPKRYWVEINRLLVPFGKHVCTGKRPRCSTCPVLDMCRQVGVGEHR